ncbi:hypothetical protein NVP2275O_085 [Vibrio phage 2.275.O._10N.286.54.E11]|nr:hypothetical protein NVP2275O_085 [Vibrio phage 2.275.O._10N.286.54.E11]
MDLSYVSIARVIEGEPREEAFHNYVQKFQVPLTLSEGKTIKVISNSPLHCDSKRTCIGYTDGTYSVVSASIEYGNRRHNDDLRLSSTSKQTPHDSFLVELGMFDTLDDLVGFNHHERCHRLHAEQMALDQQLDQQKAEATENYRDSFIIQQEAIAKFKSQAETASGAILLATAPGRRKMTKYLELLGWHSFHTVETVVPGNKYYSLVHSLEMLDEDDLKDKILYTGGKL